MWQKIGNIKGVTGADGKSVELFRASNFIVWRYVGSNEINPLVDLNELKPRDGVDGMDGADGVSFVGASVNDEGVLIIQKSNGSRIAAGKVRGGDGVSIESLELNDEGELIVIKSNGVATNLGKIKGEDGKDGDSAQWHGNAYTELKEMEDVTVTSPADSEVLTYSSVTRKWTNQAAAGTTLRQGNFYAASPTDSTIVLVPYALYAFTIDRLYGLKTTSGTITAAIQINGSNVTSLSSLSVTSTPQSPTATGANSVAIGDRVTIVLTSSSTPVDLEFTLKATTT